MSKAKEWGERLEKLVAAYEARIAELEQQLAAPSVPDEHEWHSVDSEHPLTVADHRRMVRLRNGDEWMMAWGGSGSAYPAQVPQVKCGADGKLWAGDPKPSSYDIIAVLRPKPPEPPPTPQPGEVWESVPVDGGGEVRQGEIVISRYGLFCLVLFFDKNGTRADVLPFAVHGLSLRHRRYGERKLTRRVS